jgi:peptide/nickel transport system substrate-binding protein
MGRGGVRSPGVVWPLAFLAALAAARPAPAAEASPELLKAAVTGRSGGRLVVGLRSEPKTFNPLVAVDSASRDVVGRTRASLVDIDRQTQKTVPGLARSWTVSPDGRTYTLKLRRGVKFSDGHPFTADDVVFTFEAYLDERNASTNRELLMVGGKPVVARKVDSHTVVVELAEPYAAAERLFDGLAILPRHLLEKAQAEGRLGQAWPTSTPPAEMAGLGPFRLKSYSPGERVVLERNPHYWKEDAAGTRLPYLDEMVFLFVPTEEAQVVRLRAGDTDLASRLSAANFAALSQVPGLELVDLGPGLEHTFLFFNLNELDGTRLPEVARHQRWFKDPAFRHAVSAAIDRPGLVRLALEGRGAALATHVTPGNRLWMDAGLVPTVRSVEKARGLLSRAGFRWNDDGALLDASGQPVEFSVAVSSSNATRVKIATLLQEDLRALGIRVTIAALESRAVLDRLMQTFDYDAALLTVAGGDVDPNVEMTVLLSSGNMHVWHPRQKSPATPWESEIDTLMRKQLTTLSQPERKKLYDRVQRVVAEQLPIIPLVGPNILIAYKKGLRNVRPGILEHYVLWNVEELSWS